MFAYFVFIIFVLHEGVSQSMSKTSYPLLLTHDVIMSQLLSFHRISSKQNMWLVDSLSCLFLSCSSSSIKTNSHTVNDENFLKSENFSAHPPVVCWHGINDNSESCKTVFSTLPNGTYTLSIQIGVTLEADQYNSVFMDMMDQVYLFKCCSSVSSQRIKKL